MGATLTYKLTKTTSSEISSQICKEVQKVVEDREWWCEPLFFFSEDNLEGATKIFLPGYSTHTAEHVKVAEYVTVDFAEDSLMAAYDMQFIIDTLAGWAMRFEVTWCIGIDGEEIGIVSPRGIDPRLIRMVASIATDGASEEMPEFHEGTIQEIQQKYASRL